MRLSEFDRTGAGSALQGAPSAEDRAEEVLCELDAVIAELENAAQGGAALDGRVHFGFRVLADQSPDIAALLISEGLSWPTVQAVLDDAIPPYTTSLDAAVDGENVMLVLRSTKRRRWGAMQRTSWGGEVMGWAATEPLARRLAALKARRAEMSKAIEEEKKARARREALDGREDHPAGNTGVLWRAEPETPGNNVATADEIRGEKAEEKEKDWEVLF